MSLFMKFLEFILIKSLSELLLVGLFFVQPQAQLRLSLFVSQ